MNALPACPSDAGHLARLHAACFTTPRPWSEAEFRDILTSTGAFLVAEEQGFVLGRCIAGEVELLTIAVDPTGRRTGIGTRLLAAFEQESRVRGGEECFLEVAEDNLAARALYAAGGYALAGRRRGYYHPPQGPAVDALILRKHI